MTRGKRKRVLFRSPVSAECTTPAAGRILPARSILVLIATFVRTVATRGATRVAATETGIAGGSIATSSVFASRLHFLKV